MSIVGKNLLSASVCVRGSVGGQVVPDVAAHDLDVSDLLGQDGSFAVAESFSTLAGELFLVVITFIVLSVLAIV